MRADVNFLGAYKYLVPLVEQNAIEEPITQIGKSDGAFVSEPKSVRKANIGEKGDDAAVAEAIQMFS